jgi:hypothetical protein
LWPSVWSAFGPRRLVLCLVGPVPACGRLDFVGPFACSRLHEERAYGSFKGNASFLGSGGQRLALLSSACAAIAMLCALWMVSIAARPSPPGRVYHFP